MNRFMGVYRMSSGIENEVFILDNMLSGDPDKVFIVKARSLNSEYYEKLKSWSLDPEAQKIKTLFEYIKDKSFPNVNKNSIALLHEKGFLDTVGAGDVFITMADNKRTSMAEINSIILERDPELRKKVEEMKAQKANEKEKVPETVKNVAESFAPSTTTGVEVEQNVDMKVATESPSQLNDLVSLMQSLSAQVASLSEEVATLKETQAPKQRKTRAKTSKPAQTADSSGSSDSVMPD